MQYPGSTSDLYQATKKGEEEKKKKEEIGKKEKKRKEKKRSYTYQVDKIFLHAYHPLSRE